jgi:dUTP pyrophosphatase
MKKERAGSVVNCEECKAEFYISPARLKNKTHTCSRECAAKVASKKKPKKDGEQCVNCGKVSFYKPSRKKRIKGFSCCSLACRGEYLKTAYLGTKNPNYKKADIIYKWFYKKNQQIQHSAKQRGLDFSLTAEMLLEQYKKQNGLCYYTGIPLQLSKTDQWKTQEEASPDILSVDRVNSEIGYIEGNIVLCCLAVNRMKGSYPASDVMGMFSYIAAKHMKTCYAEIKRVRENAILPHKASLGDIGYDLYVSTVIDEGTYLTVGTGIAISPAIGWYFDVVARSSLHKKGLMLYNCIGIIDNSYQGEIILKLFKTTSDSSVNVGDRIAQLIARRYTVVELEEVSEFSNETDRGTSGFGSTGKN